MDKLQIAAIALAVVLVVIAFISGSGSRSSPSHEASRAASQPAQQEAAPAQPALPAVQPVPMTRREESEGAAIDMTQREVRVIENDAIRVRVSNRGGRLESIQLKAYADRVGPGAGPVELVTDPARGTLLAVLGSAAELSGAQDEFYKVIQADTLSVELRLERSGLEITRRITLDDAGYGARLRVSLKNRGELPVEPRFQLVWYGRERERSAPDHFQAYSVVASTDGEIERRAVAGIGRTGFLSGLTGSGPPTGSPVAPPVDWAGVDSRYFLTASIAENPREAAGYLGPLGADEGWSELSYPPFYVPVGTGVERSYRLYMGPKVRAVVHGVDAQLLPALDVGWTFVRPLVTLFAGMLSWTHAHIVANYGVAIILLTIVLRLLTYPLTQRSMKSMKKFGVIAPQMKEVQEKYADDKAKMQEELMALYRRKGMNPLSAMGGGCVPMLIQMPFMIALYFALQSSIELRHAPFLLWINDLSAPENFLAIAGLPIRVLPLLMGATMVLQQRMTPSPSADPQQKQMMTMMSVLFIFLFYQFPSGLVLYWFVSNLLGIVQQLLVNRQTSEGAPA